MITLTEKQTRNTLILILALFILLGATYSVVVPPFEASDELWHYPMVKYIADHWRLPTQEPGIETPWRQEGSQPPLYYALGALATFWIDTSDMETVRHLNRHADNGIATPDGNVNLVVHRPEREAFPWQGTVLAVRLVRFLSVLMGAAAVYLTYLIARETWPYRPDLALGAAAIHGFTPMVVFISGAVNNDNLAMPLASLALLMLIRLARQRTWTTRQALLRYLALGVTLGLAALTKLGWPALALLSALVVVVRTVRRCSRSGSPTAGWIEFFVGGMATALPLLLIAGWWYLRNFELYGDPLGLNVFKVVLGTREVPADLAQLWRERYSFVAGYWGNFGGLNVPMPGWVYSVLNGVTMLAALGLLVALARFTFRVLRDARQPSSTFQSTHTPVYRYVNIPLFLCLLWSAGVFFPWALVWARDTWSSQGRLVFSAISTWSLLLTLGLASWVPQRWGRWAVAFFALFLLGLTIVAPFAWIAPTYALPEPMTDTQVAAIAEPLVVDFGGVMQFLGYDLETSVVEPGGQVVVTLYWEALSPTDRDYTTFVHLVDELDLVVAQRDTYPGLGRLSTTWLEPGFRWADRYVVQIPATAYAPDEVQVEVGLYDAVTGMRLPATGPDGESLGDHVCFGHVRLRPAAGELPNPISINFGNRMELVGYDLDRRVVRPGEMATLTLYWRGLRPMDVDYIVSVQWVDFAQRKAAQHDGPPLGGTAPTTTWEPGQTLTDRYVLPISPDVQPGVYDVQIVVYQFEEGKIKRLPTIPPDGQMQTYHVTLTTVRVEP